MPSPDQNIVAHYGSGGLFDRIAKALSDGGIALNKDAASHMKLIDEFHIGGAKATAHLLDPLNLPQGARVLDIGSGIGGPARFMAARYGAEVTGIDLTPEFVDTARRLTEALGQSITYVTGSALDLPFEAGQFDLVTMLHVGMNLPDKRQLFAEAHRVLKPGSVFAVYDVMRLGDHPQFPLPWASTPEGSFLSPPGGYLESAQAAGFMLKHRADRGDMAREFFADMQARIAENGPPAFGLPLLMGPEAPKKVANMVASLGAGNIAPVEMIFTKPADK